MTALAFTAPHVDYHALAPEIILASTLVVVLLVDLASERNRPLLGTICGIGLLASMVPIITLAVDGADRLVLSGNPAYVVDNFALALKALFLISGYVVVLLSTNYVAEGDYYEGEYYFLLLSSVLGMVVMASSRDLITIFIALETLSIPAYMLAAWRKRDAKSNEAGLKYYLMGVFASAIMLYDMSLLYGVTGSTLGTDSAIAQAGYMLAPLAVAGDLKTSQESLSATIIYLLIYAAMNLGAFAVIITVARKTRSGEISSLNGLFEYAPGLTVLMTVFLFA